MEPGEVIAVASSIQAVTAVPESLVARGAWGVMLAGKGQPAVMGLTGEAAESVRSAVLRG